MRRRRAAGSHCSLAIAIDPNAPVPRSLLLTENFPPRHGGTCRWFWELYSRLPERARVAAAALPGAGAFDRDHPAAVVRLPLDFPSWALIGRAGWRRYRRAAAAVQRELLRAPARAVHAARLLPEGWLARRTGLPFACYVHGEELVAIASSRQFRWMARRVLARRPVLIANSSNTARLLAARHGVAPDTVEILHPGVDAQRFRPAPQDPAARAALGWSQGPVVLTVARLQERKGHDRMLAALPALLARQPRLLWAVIGDGSRHVGLRSEVAAKGLDAHVRFHGEIDDRALVRAYQQCDLFVLPNREAAGDFEGFGMVLLEAQACGRAVVAGASGGTGEAMRDGETGLRVDADDPAQIAAAIRSLLDDPERLRAMGQAARRFAERFDWEACRRRAVEIWDRRGV
jgi:phosphatidylinositol alpha-1,6-mannosyltransferase